MDEDSSALWKKVQATADDLLSREPIKDQGYRALVFASQIGDLLKNYTHDPKVNPEARRFLDEVTHAGDALIQLLIYARSRGLDIGHVYGRAIARMYGKEWADDPTAALPPVTIPGGALAAGLSAAPGLARGPLLKIESSWSRARVTHEIRSLSNGLQPIVAMSDYNETIWPAVHDNIDKIGGLLLLKAGPLSHPANVCNDEGKPCIVGVVGYGELVTGQIVEMESSVTGEIGVVRPDQTARRRGLDEF